MSYTDEDIAFLKRIGQEVVKETKPKATDKVEE
jgi:hypothetical protein